MCCRLEVPVGHKAKPKNLSNDRYAKETQSRATLRLLSLRVLNASGLQSGFLLLPET